MKKPLILSVAFVVVAAAVIWGGAWYAEKNMQSSSNQSQQSGSEDQAAMQQALQNLKVEDVIVGTGTVAQLGDTVTVNYTGTFDDGSKFDSSYDHGQPFSFILGAGKVIPGWDVGVQGMKVGGKRNLTIPPELAYGPSGRGPIPPNATLHFTIELVSVSTSTAQEQL